MRRSLIVSALLLMPFAAGAVTKPPEIASSIHADEPVGAAEMNKLVFHVYDASFWSDKGAAMQAPYALSIVYDMGFTNDELVDRTMTELKHVSSFSDTKLEHYQSLLKAIWPNIISGDRITAFTPDNTQTVFYYNGKKVGQIADAEFTKAFFGIWLSEKTSEPQMRKGLLAKN